RGQAWPYAQEPRQDQAERAEHLGHTDEPHEQARQRYRPRHLIERQDQLHTTGEQKDKCEQPLHDPQGIGHDRSPPWRLWIQGAIVSSVKSCALATFGQPSAILTGRQKTWPPVINGSGNLEEEIGMQWTVALVLAGTVSLNATVACYARARWPDRSSPL